MDQVFRALADPGRRLLLDRLRQDNGQTLGQLCEYLEMARQSVSQHLAVLESANLISSVRRGRLKLHYLNPVPLHEITDRWIQPFESYRLHALHEVKLQAEETHMTGTTDKPTFVYVTYIHSTPEKVWEALTSAEMFLEFARVNDVELTVNVRMDQFLEFVVHHVLARSGNFAARME